MRDNIVNFEEKKELSDKEMVEAVLGDLMAVLQAPFQIILTCFSRRCIIVIPRKR